MNGKDLLMGMSYIDPKYIEEAETAEMPGKRQETETARKRISFRRPFLVAALIALALLLVGCAVVYVMKMQDMKVGEQQSWYDAFDYDTLEYLGRETYTEQVFTVAGLQGTPAYQAAQEWFAFKQSYDPDNTIRGEVWGNEPEFPAEYSSYNLYTQEMKEKLDEIAEKYGLKLAGAALDFRTVKNMCQALGIEKIQTAQNDVTIKINNGTCRENGNFSLSLECTFPEAEDNGITSTDGTLRWNRKDCFSEDVITFEDTGDWREWNYTTTSGNEVLITCSPSDWRGWIICNREEAVMSLQFQARRDLGSDDGWEYQYMTDGQMEQLADAIDFSIQPRVATQEDVDNQPAIPNASTQDGYTVELKSVETDGWVVRIVMGITAPEGTVINRNPYDGSRYYILGCTNWDDLTPIEGNQVAINGGWGSQEDNDGLDNTQDLVLERYVEMEDGSAPFAVGTVWSVRFEDLEARYWNEEKGEWVTDSLAEGEWAFTITFGEDNGDYRMREFVEEPITVSAVTGWKPDGTDVYQDVEITSFALHAMSAAVKHTYDAAVEFTPMYAVMKDGAKVQFQETGGSIGTTWYQLEQTIDVEQVDHILLPDGTKLMAE